MNERPPPTNLWLRLAYGFGSVAYGVKDNGFAWFLLFYYDQVLGLSAFWAGLAMFLAMVFDAVSDPIVGYISDNWRSRFGRRHPFMYAAALPVAASYLFLWNPPVALEGFGLFLWLAVVAILVRTLITVYEIPSTALAAELTDRYDERTALFSFRYMFGWLGGLTMAILAYGVFFATDTPGGQGQLEADGYRVYGVAASLLMLFAILVSAGGTHHRIPHLRSAPDRARPNLAQVFRELRETLANRSIRVLFLGAISYAWAAGIVAALSLYLNTYFWGFTNVHLQWINSTLIFSAIAAMVFTPRFSRGFEKKHAAVTLSLVALTLYPILIGLRFAGLLPPPGSDALFIIVLIILPIDVAIIISANILVASMVADIAEESELETGRRSEGVFFAALSFARKATSGLGIASASLLLWAVGFPSDAAGAQNISDATLWRFGLAYVVCTTFFYLLAVFFFSRYPITRAGHEDNLRALELRRAGAS